MTFSPLTVAIPASEEFPHAREGDWAATIRIVNYTFKPTSGPEENGFPIMSRLACCRRLPLTHAMRYTPIPPRSPTSRWMPMIRFRVLKDVASALKESHSKDIIHGNLTPACVQVGENGRTTIRKSPPLGCMEDVTVCRWTEEEAPNAIYHARWVAPELFTLPDKDADYPCPTKMSDVYSFGCLMLQVLTGQVPYCATKRSEQVVYLKYLGREPIDAQTPEVAGHYVAFMRKCWSPVPENRPTIETVVDFVHEEMEKLGE